MSYGTIAGRLYPGALPLGIPLTLSNPNSVPIHVTRVTVAVTSGPIGCDTATNARLQQSNASDAIPVEVPANGAVTLPAEGVSAPTIQLVDRPVNQDACTNATFPLRFSGSAHS